MDVKKTSTNTINSWILGSSSKWRRAIFLEHFQSDLFAVADIDEKAIHHPKAEIMTQMIARAKAEEIIRITQGGSEVDCPDNKCDLKDNILICCDQVIRFNGEIREKPETREECHAYLRSYQQQPNEFVECINGICAYFNGQFLSHYEVSKLTFKNLTDEKINELVKIDDLMTCAGGFTICHMEVNDLKGSLNGVEGFPIQTVRQLGKMCSNLHVHGNVTHCVFNIGVLLNVEGVYMKGHKEVCKKYNAKFTRENNSLVTGLHGSEAARKIVEAFDFKEVTVALYLEELYAIIGPMLMTLELLAGAEQLTNHARGLSIPLALVCRSSCTWNALKTTAIGKQLAAMFSDNIICDDNIVDCTTRTNIYQQAFQKFVECHTNVVSPQCETVMVFEDTPLGVREACAAGMRVVMCPSVHFAGCLPDDVESDCLLEVETLQDFNVAQFIKQK